MAPSHRERLLPAKGLPQDRNSLRQAGKKLSRFRLPHSRYHMVDLMSFGPRCCNPNKTWMPGTRPGMTVL